MTDKEYLELAAKAMGYVPHHSYREKLNALLWISKSGFPSTWGPFDDDKDAFRLAIDLNINLTIMPWRIEAQALNQELVVENVVNDNKHAATRRAIVRAAAEIGKGMVANHV